jgi:hypothetical protein
MVKPYVLTIAGVTDDLPDGQTGTAYSQQLVTIGLTNPVFSLVSGSLPTGLSMSASGLITGTPTMVQDQTFTIRMVDDAGFNCVQDVEINVLSGTCSVLPTQTTNQATGSTSTSIAFASGDKFLTVLDSFAPALRLYNVANGGFVLVATVVPVDTQGRIVWSPAANEWVHFGTAGGATQTNFVSYSKAGLAPTGGASGAVVGAFDIQPWSLIAHSTTGRVYGLPVSDEVRTYNSIARTIGAGFSFNAFAVACIGSIGLDETGNRLFIAGGFNSPDGVFTGNASLLFYNSTTLALLGGTNPLTLPNPFGHGCVAGCVYNPDNGMVYVAGNDENADGGDVLWVVNPNTRAVVATIRMLTNQWNTTLSSGTAFYPTTLIYDAATHQIYAYTSNNRFAGAAGRILVACCDSNTRVGVFNLPSDPQFGTFLGNVVFGDVHDTVPVQTTNTVFAVESFFGTLFGYTFP